MQVEVRVFLLSDLSCCCPYTGVHMQVEVRGFLLSNLLCCYPYTGGGEGVLDPEVLAQLPQSVQLSILEKLRDAAQTGVHLLSCIS